MGNIFTNPALYDAAYWWKINDIDFIVNWVNRIGGPVLELAAGTGRLAIPILEKGHTYVGIDNSPEFVAWAGKKLKTYRERGKIVLEDMENFALNQTFEFIFIGFNSLFLLNTKKQVLSCFKHVRDHLTDTGTFLIDCFVPNPEFLYRDEKQLYEVMEDHPPRLNANGWQAAGGQHCVVRERNRYNPETQINHIWWYFCNEGADTPEIYEFDMHMIFPNTMDRLLTEAGLIVRDKFGDYNSSPFDKNSRLQIYVCGK